MGTAGESWAAVAARYVDPSAAARSGTELDRRYAEPHRRYHTAAHAAAVVRDATWLAGQVGLGRSEADVVVLAACAHDVVYDADPGNDERASAEWARTHLAGSSVAEPVARMVLATVDHRAEDAATQVLLDADLAILGAPVATYAGYVTAVRAEYAAVPDAAWRQGRGDVLRGLLDRVPLYRTAAARERWEDAARRNLRDELGTLGSPH